MSKKTLNAANLEDLGAEKLAALLLEVSAGSADIKRRLRMELSHNLGAVELAHDVRKRLASLRKSSSFVGWRKRKGLIKDLSTQVTMITEKIAPDDANIAFDLLWQFIEIAPSIYGRVDDSRGDVGDVFRTAIAHFETIAPRALIDPVALADRVWGAVRDNGFGEWDGIITLMAPTLGTVGLARLQHSVEAYAEAPTQDASEDHEALQFLRQLRGGSTYVADRKARFVKSCLQQIATAAGDTNAYIAQFSDQDLQRKDIAAEVAMLLLSADQVDNALDTLLGADQDEHMMGQVAWDDAYIACLLRLGRIEEAQTHRWSSFCATLNAQHLGDYLKLMPDFDDVEAEDAAKRHVADFPNFSMALTFFIKWPDLLSAARLVEQRSVEINGNHYTILTPAAEALRLRHPLAAILVFRAMIDYALRQGVTSRYGHAAEHLADCGFLDAEISDYGNVLPHDAYVQDLKRQHDRKASFWKKVG